MSIITVSKPDYGRALEALRGRLTERSVNVGDRLPSLRELSEVLGVQKETVRQVLWQLARDGYIEIRQGSGSYVKSLPGETSASVRRVGVFISQEHRDAMYGPGLFSEFEHRPGRSCRFDLITSIETLKSYHLSDYEGIFVVVPSRAVMAQVTAVVGDTIPVVSLSRSYSDLPGLAVMEDNYASAYELTAWLIRKGNGRVAFVGREDYRKESFMLGRLHGWKAAIQEAGLDESQQQELWFPSSRSPQLIQMMSRQFEQYRPEAMLFSMSELLEEYMRLVALHQWDRPQRNRLACIDTNFGHADIAYAAHDAPQMIERAMELLSNQSGKSRARVFNVAMSIYYP